MQHYLSKQDSLPSCLIVIHTVRCSLDKNTNREAIILKRKEKQRWALRHWHEPNIPFSKSKWKEHTSVPSEGFFHFIVLSSTFTCLQQFSREWRVILRGGRNVWCDTWSFLVKLRELRHLEIFGLHSKSSYITRIHTHLEISSVPILITELWRHHFTRCSGTISTKTSPQSF